MQYATELASASILSSMRVSYHLISFGDMDGIVVSFLDMVDQGRRGKVIQMLKRWNDEFN